MGNDEGFEMVKINLNIPTNNLTALDKIVKRYAGNRSSFINHLIFDAIIKAVKDGVLKVDEIPDDLMEG